VVGVNVLAVDVLRVRVEGGAVLAARVALLQAVEFDLCSGHMLALHSM